MENENQPLVSIGVPVFNGEKGIGRALGSLLDQDYSNLEIIISDNASTDSTPEICAEYVRKDSRVKYSRSKENLGVTWNFRRVFECSSGKYFMWAAHDDERDRSFVSACVEKMEQCPKAAICQPHAANFIEGREELFYISHLDSLEGVTDVVERYREMLKHVSPMLLYGLHRSSVIRKTRMYQRVIAADMVFIQEESIYGDFVQIPELLFTYFAHKNWNTVDQDYYVFFGKEKKPWWYLPFVVVFCNHWNGVARSAVPVNIKAHLWIILIKNIIGQLVLKVLIKVAGLLCPKRWKEKLGTAIYWAWMHSPNMNVCNPDLFLERVIKPRLGWWE